MSIMEISRSLWSHGSPSEAPYQVGDRITAGDGEGGSYVGRVETVRPDDGGTFTVLAELREPRHLRGHLLATVVDADGTVAVVES